MESGNESGCGIRWASGAQSQLSMWWVVMGDKWQVAMKWV